MILAPPHLVRSVACGQPDARTAVDVERYDVRVVGILTRIDAENPRCQRPAVFGLFIPPRD